MSDTKQALQSEASAACATHATSARSIPGSNPGLLAPYAQMRRQKIRTALMLAWILVFPITLYYFSPYLPFQGLAESVISGSLVLFGLLFVSSLLLSRLFCGWICPAGAIQHFTAMARGKRVQRRKLHLIKYLLIWFPWVAGLIAMALNANSPFAIVLDYQTVYGISIASPMAYIIYLSVVALFAGLSLAFGRRTACHTVCWMAPFLVFGRALGKLLRLPQVHLRAKSADCISCGRCETACPMSIQVQAMVKSCRVATTDSAALAPATDSTFMPSTTAAETTQLSSVSHFDCINCFQCVDSCPKSVLRMSMRPDRA